MDKFAPVLWSLLAIVIVVLAAGLWANRPRRIAVEAPLPASFPTDGFSHDTFAELLQTYVSADGRVDYARWHDTPGHVAALDTYLAAINAYSPDSTPERFPTRNDELAYWMYGYNAWVIKGVLMNWPLTSVTDVKAPLEVVKGMGFFFQLRFPFGGEHMSLLKVENDRIRKGFRDPRIHFVLNCASESCPVARPELPTGNELQELLAAAAVEFVNDSDNVFVDHDRRIVFLSTIFKWYEKDFVNHMVALGRPANHGLLDYVGTVAEAPLLGDLQRATDYVIEFRDYDWALNGRD